MTQQYIHIPKVSVIIPLYQTERYISETLQSVAAQTFADFEILVVDDGSSDRGPKIAANFGDPRLRVISQANRGLAGARNTGIRESRGNYLAFLDADDLWEPGKLAAHVAFLDSRPDVGVSFSSSRLIDDDGRALGLLQRPAVSEFDAGYIFCRNPVGNGSAPVIRRQALEDVAFSDPALQRRLCWFDESFRQSEDIECWTRIAVCTHWKFGFLDQPLNKYRISSGGLSANLDRQLETWRRFRAKAAAYAPALERDFGDLAEAFQLRYLARRAIKSGNGPQALGLVCQALACSPGMLFREPSRTLATLLAAILVCAMPHWATARLQSLVLRPRTPAKAG